MLEDLFTEIEKNHNYGLAINSSAIDDLEKKLGYKLPQDLKDFYHRYQTVNLFNDEWGPLYRFIPVSEIKNTGYDVYGDTGNPDKIFWRESWFTICKCGGLSEDFISIDLQSSKDAQYNYIDCFHETYGVPGESRVIAKSFTELLQESLHGGSEQFYLKEGFKGYGDALEINAETAIQRMEPIKAGWLGEIIWYLKHPHLIQIVKNGWIVEFSQPGNSHYKFFADKDYGSKEKSFKAAKSYLDENKK